MPKVKVKQDGKDGKGKPVTLTAKAIRVKAKEVQTARNSSIKVTGLKSGAVFYIDLIVNNGDKVKGFYQPPITLTNPNVPTAGFDYKIIGGGKGNI